MTRNHFQRIIKPQHTHTQTLLWQNKYDRIFIGNRGISHNSWKFHDKLFLFRVEAQSKTKPVEAKKNQLLFGIASL